MRVHISNTKERNQKVNKGCQQDLQAGLDKGTLYSQNIRTHMSIMYEFYSTWNDSDTLLDGSKQFKTFVARV